jgi:hypothetical protein
MSETCKVSCQNKFVNLVHLVSFIIMKFVMMYGHVNVKCEPFSTHISPKSDHKCAEYKHKFIYSSQYSMAFNVPISIKLSLLLISYNIPVLFQSPLHDLLLKFHCYCHALFSYNGPYSGAISCGTALQARRTHVQFPMVSPRFFIDVILPTALWLWGRWCH